MREVKIVCSLSGLMIKAKAVGDAKKEGDRDKITEAENDLEAYKKICLEADEMITPFTWGSLLGK